ncbi:MAG: hypothetical protein PVF43_02195 [Candidatus Eiseniibacteriota bacterium]|jgi:hypothetical protein
MADHDRATRGPQPGGGGAGPQEPIPPGQGPFDREINLRAVVLFGGALAVSVIVSMILMWFMFQYFDARGDALAERRVSPLVAPGERRLPPEPRLQASPPADLIAMRAAEDSVLTGYGWVDQHEGIVRIPVAEAIDLVADRGLVRATPTPAGSVQRPWQRLESSSTAGEHTTPERAPDDGTHPDPRRSEASSDHDR